MARTLHPRLSELGRIRIGDLESTVAKSGRNKGKAITRPRQLTTFRFTSQEPVALKKIADLYGGEVTEWEQDMPPPLHQRQWQVYTESNTIEVVLPTAQSISHSYERWANRVCTWRCDGTTITYAPLQPEKELQPCECADEQENACPLVFRLSVLLPDISGLATWRLDTHGYYAASEMLGQIRLLEQQGAGQALVPATLRIERRTRSLIAEETDRNTGEITRKPTTRNFPVVVLTPHSIPKQIPMPEPPKQLASAAVTAAQIFDQDDVGQRVRQEAEASKPAQEQLQQERHASLEPYRQFLRLYRSKLTEAQRQAIALSTFGESWSVIASAPLERLIAGQQQLQQWSAYIERGEPLLEDGEALLASFEAWQAEPDDVADPEVPEHVTASTPPPENSTESPQPLATEGEKSIDNVEQPALPTAEPGTTRAALLERITALLSDPVAYWAEQAQWHDKPAAAFADEVLHDLLEGLEQAASGQETPF